MVAEVWDEAWVVVAAQVEEVLEHLDQPCRGVLVRCGPEIRGRGVGAVERTGGDLDEAWELVAGLDRDEPAAPAVGHRAVHVRQAGTGEFEVG